MNYVIMILMVTAILLPIIFALLSRRSLPRCPECGSGQVGKHKTPTSMGTYNYWGSAQGGGYSSVQVQYTAQYTCNACHTRWATTELETG